MKKDIITTGVAVVISIGVAMAVSLSRGIESDFIVPRKQIDLKVLEGIILERTGWQRYTPTTGGFSGLNMDEVEEGGIVKTRIRIVWSDDGRLGYEKNLTQTEKKTIQSLIETQ